MANKLKNMRLTSVDLVRNGANQEADICLFKSADPEETPVQPTTEEKNIFKRFINWLRENPAEADGEPADPETVEKDYTTFDSLTAARENNEKLWQYTNALTESIRSIQMDQDLDKDQKYQLMAQSLDQFDEAMDKLIEALSGVTPPDGLAKSDEEEEEDDEWDDEEWDDEEDDEEEEDPEEDVEKFNPYHGADGRFSNASGGGKFYATPGKSKAHDLAIQRQKDKASTAGATKTPAKNANQAPKFGTGLMGNEDVSNNIREGLASKNTKSIKAALADIRQGDSVTLSAKTHKGSVYETKMTSNGDGTFRHESTIKGTKQKPETISLNDAADEMGFFPSKTQGAHTKITVTRNYVGKSADIDEIEEV